MSIASAQRFSVLSHQSTPLPESILTPINNALLASGSIPQIHATLLHECQSSGWLDDIRARVLQLLRSGECSNYGEVMGIIMREVKGREKGEDEYGEEIGSGSFSVATTNGMVNGANGGEGRGLRVPTRVVEEGVKVVRAALEDVVDVVVEDGEEEIRR